MKSKHHPIWNNQIPSSTITTYLKSALGQKTIAELTILSFLLICPEISYAACQIQKLETMTCATKTIANQLPFTFRLQNTDTDVSESDSNDNQKKTINKTFSGIVSSATYAENNQAKRTERIVINNRFNSLIIDESRDMDIGQYDSGPAVQANNYDTATNIDIKTQNITNQGDGLIVNNEGNGFTHIKTGNINATGTAIAVTTGELAQDISIDTQNIQSSESSNVVTVQNRGKNSSISIKSGNIYSSDQSSIGITAENQENTKNILIQAKDINTGVGINAFNNGTGFTTINTGNITAEQNGINATNGDNTQQLTINTKNISASTAISAMNSGKNSIFINTNGNVTGNQMDGINAINIGTAKNININHSGGTLTGANNGINTVNIGTGDINIEIAGNVKGGNDAIIAQNSGSAKDINIDQINGNISGDLNGINIINNGLGNIRIKANGQIQGDIGSAINISGKPSTTTNIFLDKNAVIKSNSGIAIQDDNTNTNIILNNGAKVSGQILLGDGNDTFTINQGDTSTITVLDAGNKDTNGLNGNGVKDIDILNINGWLTGSSSSEGKENDTALRNWSIINIGGKSQSQTDSTLNLTGDLTTNQLNINRSGKLTFNGFSAEASSDHSLSEPHSIIINGNVANAGIISLGNKHTGDNLTITGDYNGAKGTLILDTELNDDKSITDKLAISGNASGTTTIRINNIKGLGADTGNSKGIEIISVAGTNITDAENEPVFTLTGSHVDAGAYEYRLFSGDQTREDSNWYLRSRIKDTPKQDDKTTIVSNHPDNKPVITKPTYRKETPLNSSTAAQLLQADSLMLANLHRRTGTTPTAEQRRSWGRVITSRTNIRQNGTTSPHTSGHYNGLQMGSDIWNNPHWHTGGYLGYLNGHLNVAGFASGINGNVGKNDIQSYFLGAYSTYTSNTGSYLDIVLQGAQHQADIRPTGNQASKQKGHGITASVEIGKPFTIGHSAWKLEPQTQIMRQWLHLNDSQISGNTTVSQNGNNVWLFRIGGRMHGDFQFNKGIFHPYARINFIYSPDGDDYTTYTTRTASTTLNTSLAHSSTEMAIGGSYEISNKMRLYGEFGHTKSNGGDAQIKAPFNGSLGFKAEW